MRNQSRVIDKTFLSLDLAEERGLIHRDYLAHCFRWSHVVKFLNKQHAYKDAHVLDVGCGKEMPLAKTLYVNKMTPKKYVGVDVNKFDIPEMLKGKKIPITIWTETDFCALTPEDVGLDEGKRYSMPDIVVCFEVLEHVQPEHCRRMLQHFMALTSDDCHYFISTPCWNGSAAENHINEMKYEALGSLIEDVGFDIQGVYGTFASISDYQNELQNFEGTNLIPTFNALREYYDTNVLSTIFAPLFPAQSRNCLWHLTKKRGDRAAQTRLYPALEQVQGPWSQSSSWRDLAESKFEEAQ